MQQSNVIFGFIAVAFVVFITMRGELPTYIQLLRGGGQTVTGAGGSSGSGGDIGSYITSIGGIVGSSSPQDQFNDALSNFQIDQATLNSDGDFLSSLGNL